MPCTRSMRSGSSRKKPEEEEMPVSAPAGSPPKTRKRTIREKKIGKTEFVQNIAEFKSPLPAAPTRSTRSRVRSKAPAPDTCETPVQAKQKSTRSTRTAKKPKPNYVTEEKEIDDINEGESDEDDLFRPVPKVMRVASKSKPSTSTAKKSAQTKSKRKIKTASKAVLEPEPISDPDVSTADEGRPHASGQIKTLTYQQLNKCHIIPVKTAFSSSLCEVVPKFFKKLMNPEDTKRQDEAFQALLNAPEVEMPPPPPPGKTKRARVKRARSPEPTPSQTSIPQSFNFEGFSTPGKKRMNMDVPTPNKEASSEKVPIASTSSSSPELFADKPVNTETENSDMNSKCVLPSKTKKKTKPASIPQFIDSERSSTTDKKKMNMDVPTPNKEASAEKVPIASTCSSSPESIADKPVNTGKEKSDMNSKYVLPSNSKAKKKTKPASIPQSIDSERSSTPDKKRMNTDVSVPIKEASAEKVPVASTCSSSPELFADKPVNTGKEKSDMNSKYVLPSKSKVKKKTKPVSIPQFIDSERSSTLDKKIMNMDVSVPNKEASAKKVPIASTSSSSPESIADKPVNIETEKSLKSDMNSKYVLPSKVKKESKPASIPQFIDSERSSTLDKKRMNTDVSVPNKEASAEKVPIASTSSPSPEFIADKPVNTEAETSDMNSTYVLPSKAEKETKPASITQRSSSPGKKIMNTDVSIPNKEASSEKLPVASASSSSPELFANKPVNTEAETSDMDISTPKKEDSSKKEPIASTSSLSPELFADKPVNTETEKSDMDISTPNKEASSEKVPIASTSTPELFADKPVNTEAEKSDMNSTYVLPSKVEKKTKPASLLNVTVCVKKGLYNQIDADNQQPPILILPPSTSKAPTLNVTGSGFVKPKLQFGMGTSGSKFQSGLPACPTFIVPLAKQPLSKQPYHFKPAPPSSDDGEMDDSFKSAISASNSFLDATVDGPLSSYDITTYEDLDEDLKHRENKTVPNWASDKESLTTALFSMVYLPKYEQSLQLAFPKPDRSYKLFPPRMH